MKMTADVVNDCNREDFDTTALSTDVESEFIEKTADTAGAYKSLADWKIDYKPIVAAVGRIALVRSSIVWDSIAERERFRIYEADHIGPTHPNQLAVPIIESGSFVDLLLIDTDDLSYRTVCWRASWLGRDALSHEKVIRLHPHPIDWLAAGCQGVCHISPISRQALRELGSAEQILCNNVATAVDAWDWGFSAEDDELKRFVIDAAPEAIRAYFNDVAAWRAVCGLRKTGLLPSTLWRAL